MPPLTRCLLCKTFLMASLLSWGFYFQKLVKDLYNELILKTNYFYFGNTDLLWKCFTKYFSVFCLRLFDVFQSTISFTTFYFEMTYFQFWTSFLFSKAFHCSNPSTWAGGIWSLPFDDHFLPLILKLPQIHSTVKQLSIHCFTLICPLLTLADRSLPSFFKKAQELSTSGNQHPASEILHN